MLSRRQFLAALGGVVVAGAGAGAGWELVERSSRSGPETPGAARPFPASGPSAASSTTAAGAAGRSGRTLVVVQLQGGNDGLNTLVPLDGRYHDARPTLAVADADLVPVPGAPHFGLHPSLAPLQDLLAAGRVAAVESVGYQHSNRSHFAALADWWSATPGQSSPTGWLGRYLDATATAGADPLRAVCLGGGSPALAADHVTPTVVIAPAAFRLTPPRGGGPLVDEWAATGAVPAGTDPDGLEAACRRATAAASEAVAVFDRLDVPAGPAGAGAVTSSLAVAAALITAQPGVEVVYIDAGGFDTHAGQAATQSRLLADVATGVAAFYRTLADRQVDGEVLLLTVSEFGRRVAENGSGGTDHGKAGVQFLVGPMVHGGVHGDVDLAHLDDGDVAAQIDTRSLYAAALGWLGGPVDEALGGHFDPLGVVAA